MEHNHQQLMSTALSHARRARRTTGRILFSAAGFGLAYLFDTENGAARRARLRRSLRQATATRYSEVSPVSEGKDPPALFDPLLRGLGAEGVGPPARQRTATG